MAFREHIQIVRQLWPLAIIVIAFGFGYVLLIHYLSNALDAAVLVSSSEWGGPETLFALTSAVLGWVTIVVLERQISSTSATMLAIGLGCWIVTIGCGFTVAWLIMKQMTDEVWGLSVVCLGSAVLAGVFRIFFDLPSIGSDE